MVEFVLLSAFFFVPLVLGLMSVGFALTRSLQAAHLTRDVGRMFVRGVDFAEQANQDLITGGSPTRPNLPPLAGGLRMARTVGSAEGGTGGDGVLVLSTLMRLATTCNCVNAGNIVLTRRIVVGNNTLHTSPYGNPAPGLVSSTTGFVKNYANNPTTRADGFASVVNLAEGELAYLVESKFRFPDLAIQAVLPNPGVAWRAVF